MACGGCGSFGQLSQVASEPVRVCASAALQKPIRVVTKGGRITVINPGDKGIELPRRTALAYRNYLDIESP